MTVHHTPHLDARPAAPAGADSGSVAKEAAALLKAVGEGDENAFTRLYDLVAPRVFGLTRRVLPDQSQAEAVAQETLIEVWRTAGRYDAKKESALAWILTISHRRSVDRVRSSGGADRRDPPAAPGPAAVRRCLESLTREEREAILLSYYGGHTYREVAELLGTRVPTIKLRMRDGLIRMRDCMEARGSGPDAGGERRDV